jgi:hypothetical protein
VLNRPVETKYYSPPPDHVHTEGHHEGYDFWSSSDQGCIPLIFTPQLLLVWSRISQREQIVSNTDKKWDLLVVEIENVYNFPVLFFTHWPDNWNKIVKT